MNMRRLRTEITQTHSKMHDLQAKEWRRGRARFHFNRHDELGILLAATPRKKGARSVRNECKQSSTLLSSVCFQFIYKIYNKGG